MQKLIVMIMAVAGTLFVLPMFFPSMNRVVFTIAQIGITWTLMATGAVFFCALKLQASK